MPYLTSRPLVELWGASHVLRGLGLPYPGHGFPALLAASSPHTGGLSAASDLAFLSWCQARPVAMRWRLGPGGQVGAVKRAVGEPASALFTTPHFLPLSGFSNCCCFCCLLPPLPFCPFSLSLSPASCDSFCLPRLSRSASPFPSPHHAPRPLPSLEAQGLGLGGLPAWARGPEWKTVVQTAPPAPTVPQGLSRVSWGLKPLPAQTPIPPR